MSIKNFNAAEWLATVTSCGYRVRAAGCVVTISRNFTPGDLSAFTDCDMVGPSFLDRLPTTSPGSTWGTDWGYSAIKNGCYTLNRSGISKRVVSKLAKMLHAGAAWSAQQAERPADPIPSDMDGDGFTPRD